MGIICLSRCCGCSEVSAGVQGKELFWNEYGVGGGSSQDGNTPAKTAVQAAATPFFGVFGAYTRARDPWQTPEVRNYNHYFYRKTLEYLDSRGSCSGCQYRVWAHFLPATLWSSLVHQTDTQGLALCMLSLEHHGVVWTHQTGH